jgi:hypothetical protein
MKDTGVKSHRDKSASNLKSVTKHTEDSELVAYNDCFMGAERLLQARNEKNTLNRTVMEFRVTDSPKKVPLINDIITAHYCTVRSGSGSCDLRRGSVSERGGYGENYKEVLKMNIRSLKHK